MLGAKRRTSAASAAPYAAASSRLPSSQPPRTAHTIACARNEPNERPSTARMNAIAAPSTSATSSVTPVHSMVACPASEVMAPRYAAPCNSSVTSVKPSLQVGYKSQKSSRIGPDPAAPRDKLRGLMFDLTDEQRDIQRL